MVKKKEQGLDFDNQRNPSNPDHKEADLIACISNGDENAFEELYRIYFGRLYRFISRITGGENIDEVINDVMYVVWKKASAFNNASLPSTWIFGIAYNKALQSLRKVQEGIEESLDAIEIESPVFGRIDVSFNQYEMKNLMSKALDSLSLEQRAVVELTYFQGLSYREISQLMGCSENTVKTRMFYSRLKLSKFFQDIGDVLTKTD